MVVLYLSCSFIFTSSVRVSVAIYLAKTLATKVELYHPNDATYEHWCFHIPSTENDLTHLFSGAFDVFICHTSTEFHLDKVGVCSE